MSNKTTYFLWLMPPPEIHERFAKIISLLSKKYHTPVFNPHITLLKGIQGTEKNIIRKISEFIDILELVPVSLTKIEYTNTYYMSLYIKVKKTDYLLKAHREAAQLLEQAPEISYTPHLSLLYGDFSKELKEGMIAHIGRDFHITFDVNKLHLISSEGIPNKWPIIETFTLK